MPHKGERTLIQTRVSDQLKKVIDLDLRRIQKEFPKASRSDVLAHAIAVMYNKPEESPLKDVYDAAEDTQEVLLKAG